MNVLPPVLEGAWSARIGWTLIHSLWQLAIVAVAYAILSLLLRRRSANVRYVLGCVALAAMVAVPVAQLLHSGATAGSSSSAAADTCLVDSFASGQDPSQFVPQGEGSIGTANELAVAPAVYAVEPELGAQSLWESVAVEIALWQTRVEPVLPWLATCWLAGVLILSLRPLGGLVTVRRLQTRGLVPLSAELRQLARSLMRRLRIDRAVEFAESALVEVPTVAGYLRPIVLLPASAVTGLTADQLELVLAHELAHIRRHDYLVNLLQTVIEALLFYHPGMWWVSAQVRCERENCCDDVAVAMCGDRARYVRALWAMESGRAATSPALAATGGSLVDRVRRLMFGRPAVSRLERATSWLAGVVVLGIVTLVISLGRSWAEAPAAAEPVEAMAAEQDDLTADADEGEVEVDAAETDESDLTLAEQQTRLIAAILAHGGQLNAGSTLPFAGSGMRVFDDNRPARARTAITDVNLRDDVANDEIVRQLNLFPHLRRLSLFGVTSVTDKGLAVVADLPELENLQIQSERITDDGLKVLAGATKLQTLSIQGRGVTDVGLAHLANLGALRFLTLAHTSVTGSGLEHLAGLPNLDSLSIFGADVTDESLAQLKDWPLRFLTVGTKTTDAGLKRVAQVSSLEGLTVYSEQITNEGVRALASLKRLRSLNLSGAPITDASLSFLATHHDMQSVSLHGTDVDGSFIQYLSGSDVESLNLIGTRLNQVNLNYLLQLPKLRVLSIGIGGDDDGDYDLTDACVPVLSQLTGLEHLELRTNRVTDEAMARLRAALPETQIGLFRPAGHVVVVEPVDPSEMKVVLGASPEEGEPALPTLESAPDKTVLREHIDEALKKVERRGHVIVGRVLVEGNDNPMDVNAQMEILAGGYFAGPVKDLQRPVGFRMHGYAPYDLRLAGRHGKVVDVGTIQLKRLTDEELAPVVGRVELEGGGDLRTVSVTFSIGHGPVNTPSNGTSPRPDWPDPVRVELDPAGRFYQTGFSPAEYYVSVKAPGYVSQGRQVEFSKGDVLNLGTIRLETPRRAEIEYVVTRELPFQLDDVKQMVVHGGDRWQIVPDPCRYDLEFKQKDGRLKFDTSYGPIELADLGPGELSDYLKIGPGAARLLPRQVPLVSGHVYLLRRSDWKGGEDYALFTIRVDGEPVPAEMLRAAAPAVPTVAEPPGAPEPVRLPAETPVVVSSPRTVDRLDDQGFSQLHRAAMGGHVERVRELLAAGANVNVEQGTYHGTPLQYAAAGGHGETVEVLLDHGATVGSRDANGRTPLVWAATNGHANVAQRLLDAGADVNATNDGGWTPLHYAVSKGHTATAQLLIDRGADVRAKNSQEKTPVNLNPGLDLRIPWRALQAPPEPTGSDSTPRSDLSAEPVREAPDESAETVAHQPDEIAAVVDGKPVRWRDIDPSPKWFEQRAEAERKYGNTRGYGSAEDYRLERLKTAIWKPILERYKRDHDLEPTEQEIEEFLVHYRKTLKRIQQESQAKLHRHQENVERLRQELAAPDLAPSARSSLEEQLASEEVLIAALETAVEHRGQGGEHDRFFATWYLRNWKLQQSLYRQYGGRVIYQQVGPEAIDALRDLAKDQEASGAFAIADAGLRQRFWEPFMREKPGVLVRDPDEVFAHPWSLMEHADAAATGGD